MAVAVAGGITGIRGTAERSLTRVGTLTAELERALGDIRPCAPARRSSAKAGASGLQPGCLPKRSVIDAPGFRVGPIMEVAVNGSFLFMLLIGAVCVSNGAMTIRALVAFLLHAT